MKTFFVFTVILTLAFIACDNEDDTGKGNNADVIGTWGDTLGEVTLEISDRTWVFVLASSNPHLGTSSISGIWTRQGNVLTLTRTGNASFGTAILSGSELRLNASFLESDGVATSYSWWDLTKGASFQREAKLTVQNESSFRLMNLRWGGEPFADVIIPSSYETRNVADSSGYLFFNTLVSIGNNEIQTQCRTQEIITVSKGETKTFVITNSTLVIALNDITNTPKTLQEVASSTP
jgi:hypothetical protein